MPGRRSTTPSSLPNHFPGYVPTELQSQKRGNDIMVDETWHPGYCTSTHRVSPLYYSWGYYATYETPDSKGFRTEPEASPEVWTASRPKRQPAQCKMSLYRGLVTTRYQTFRELAP